jgi:hypothetical protein
LLAAAAFPGLFVVLAPLEILEESFFGDQLLKRSQGRLESPIIHVNG